MRTGNRLIYFFDQFLINLLGKHPAAEHLTQRGSLSPEPFEDGVLTLFGL